MSTILKFNSNYTLKKLITFQLRSLCTENRDNHYDIIIAGGGMVGAAMALSLGKNSILNSKRVLLLEGRPKIESQISDNFSNRVSAITLNTYNFFNNLSVWQHIEQKRFAPVTSLQVWDGCSDALIVFNNDDFSSNVAYIIENNVILNSLFEELQHTPVEIKYKAKIKEYQLQRNNNHQTTISLENGEIFNCDLLIGADGANSKVREAMGVHYLNWNYNDRSIVATVELSEETSNTVAWQRFNPDGPIALLPLTSKLSSLVWSTNKENARKLIKLPKDQFIDAINDAFWKKYQTDPIVNRASRILNDCFRSVNIPSNGVRQLPPQIVNVDDGSIASFPVAFGHCTNYVEHGVALIGDAAHRVHPLAGQGVNLGFKDVQTLTDTVADSVYKGNKIGDWRTLKEYESQSQRNNIPTVFGIDILQKLYSTNFTPVVLARTLGLQVVHVVKPLKKVIMQYAQG